MNSIDKLGMLNAQIAEIQAQAAEIKKELIESIGPGHHADGDLFRVSIAESERVTLDADDVRRFLHPNQLRVCERKSKVVTVRCVARKASPIAVAA